ncbi:hypothetical protein P8605_03030 [Streptomyces sp. T-3]|nr:hypothetical protein [Streptomyces sp. T-3]
MIRTEKHGIRPAALALSALVLAGSAVVAPPAIAQPAAAQPATARPDAAPDVTPGADLPAECRPGTGKTPPWLAKLSPPEQAKYTGQQWYKDWLSTTMSLCTDLTHLATDNPQHTLKWRTDKALLFRGAGLGSHSVPDHVFTVGADPWDLTAGGNLKIRPGVGIKNSALSSTTYRNRHARYFGTWVYVIDAPGGIQVDGVLHGDPVADESEIAFPGGIRPERIMAAYRLADKGVWQKGVEYRWNPNYRGSVPKPTADEIDVFLGTGPTLPGKELTAKGGRSVDPDGRVHRFPKSTKGTTLATDPAAADPSYVPWGSVPSGWVAGQQDHYISSRVRPYATCHELDEYEFTPNVGGMVDALSRTPKSKLGVLKGKVLMAPGTCYDSAEPPELAKATVTGSGRTLTVDWTPSKVKGVTGYAIHARASDGAEWKQLATVDGTEAGRRVLSAAELKPFTPQVLDPTRYPDRVAVTALIAPEEQTTVNAACGFPVTGSFAGKWKALGGQIGRTGCPSTAERKASKGGVFQRFQDGILYWSRPTGPHAVWGVFLKKYGELGYERGQLGFPTSDEADQSKPVCQVFEHGTLYFNRTTKDVTVNYDTAVTGSFAGKWKALGGAEGTYGCPTTSERKASKGGVFQRFTGGNLYWSKTTGPHGVRGPFLTAYGKNGYEGGKLGFPMGDERPNSTGAAQRFQGGVMVWNQQSGEVVIK